MENLDRNGTYVQRRKMYIGLPLHNMKSRVEFDWQNNDISVQDQVGLKYKLNREHEEIRKKYEQTLDKRIYKKYVEHDVDNYSFLKDLQMDRDNRNGDILTKEVENFNHSKVFSPLPDRRAESMMQSAHNQEHNEASRPQKVERQYDRLNQSQNVGSPKEDNSPISPRYERQQEYEAPHYESQNYRGRSDTNYRYDRPYNPQSYQTLNPATDRYRPFEPHPVHYNYDYTVPQRSQKMLSAVVPSDYPLRNVIPDKLENHLREKVKADRKKAVKVTLNLFDYNKR